MTQGVAKDFSHLYSDETKSRMPSQLKSIIHYFNDPNLIFLGGGLPMSDYFPWDNLTVESPLPPFSNGIGAKPSGDDADTCQIHITKNLEESQKGVDIPLSRSLQYGYSQGQPEITKFFKEHHSLIHDMKYENWDVLATIGNTGAWESVLRIFCNRGDTILAEQFAFSSSISAAEAQGVNVFPIPLDEHGIIPSKLETILDNWTEGAAKPKLLYTVPTGQNPTGSSLSFDRKEEIYRIAQKHDFIIIEDEPYYFLQMEKYEKDPANRVVKSYADHKEFIQNLEKSFVSIDTEGRVLRLDSLSKVLAPGTRFGWIVGAKDILARILSLQEMTIQAPAGFTQSIIAGTMNRWGQEGYLDWLIGLRHEYTKKRDCCIDALYKYLPQVDYIKINPPIAGMFFTVNIDASKHPEFATKYGSDPEKVEKAIFDRSIASGVLVVPGNWFKSQGQTTPPQPEASFKSEKPNEIFFRGTYAAVPLDKMTVGLHRFGDGLYEEFQLTK
ncbi:bifunctional 2-aminoadipate transaminase/aromatic-amino-acid:2-oxoglutarate transaminase [Kluyveromyces lactis]|uniref:aromatic-amino-acid transaminase n=1 Tax=Kluyveromyces lactis (strain ATCC 8585 / CBS 2359 / DSM 70799 / NBRC 1267 / NRRL Y-1140 / WM37) TaxID=284590 RepID=Q6CKK3_KLULA|nr:uncharacterized protein KLLA0_F10021g [Kluyveromyces lactis]CAG98244.1 KLLA0F10021p [Kluyveromyces lactis]|eukprot:XP_455536.1 uncharacterized protein KLLA0_F10021g [Kluyveromyces lactis]